MSDLQALKKRIFEQERIPDVLEALECQGVKMEGHGDRYVAQLPPEFNSKNRRSVQVKNNESLHSYVRSRGVSGDIYSLIGYLLYGHTNFDDVRSHIHEIHTWLCQTLGYYDALGFDFIEQEKDWNAWLRPIQKARQGKIEILENIVWDERILEQYIDMPHMKWIREGIDYHTQREFGVRVDISSERIVFPVHNKHGQLVGVKGRYFGSNPEIENEYKYLALYPYSKSLELFNLHRAAPYAQKQGEVIVVEAAKSCMLLHQWGYRNCVSTEGKTVSPVQAKLLKDLRVPILFAYDQGVEVEEVQSQTKHLKTRVVYAITDEQQLLGEKESVVDKGKNVWRNLYTGYRHKIF